jgi:hypothetical protein
MHPFEQQNINNTYRYMKGSVSFKKTMLRRFNHKVKNGKPYISHTDTSNDLHKQDTFDSNSPGCSDEKRISARFKKHSSGKMTQEEFDNQMSVEQQKSDRKFYIDINHGRRVANQFRH